MILAILCCLKEATIVGTKDHPRLSIARSLRASQKGFPTDYSLLNPKDTVDLLLLKQRGTHSLRGIHLFEFLGVVLKRWLVGCFDTTPTLRIRSVVDRFDTLRFLKTTLADAHDLRLSLLSILSSSRITITKQQHGKLADKQKPAMV